MRAAVVGKFAKIGARDQCPELALFAAILKLAILDARAGDREAAEWLKGDTCRAILSRLEPDPDKLDFVVNRLSAENASHLSRRETA